MSYPPLTIPKLKVLTEKADGLRGENLCLAVIGDAEEPAGSPNARRIDILPCKDVKENEQILFLLENQYPLEFKPRIPSPLTLQPNPEVRLSKSGRDVSTVDAWFTTPAAVDKFVVPYYSRILGPQWALDIQTAFYLDGRILAVVHLPESYEDMATAIDNAPGIPRLGFHGVVATGQASMTATPLEELTGQALKTLESSSTPETIADADKTSSRF